jgi:serine/threonine-protein kinase SRPK3
MLESIDKELLDRWQEKWRIIGTRDSNEDPLYLLQEWLEEMYFNGERREYSSKEGKIC